MAITALSFIVSSRRRGRSPHRQRGRSSIMKAAAVDYRGVCPADDESAKLAAVVVTKKPEDDFVDPAISGKSTPGIAGSDEVQGSQEAGAGALRH